MDELGEAEVEDLDVSAFDEEEIRRLDIAVDDAAVMRCVERVRDMDAEFDRLVNS